MRYHIAPLYRVTRYRTDPSVARNIRLSETGAVIIVAWCHGNIRLSETGVVRSGTPQEAGEHRSHHLYSPLASNFDMEEPCFDSPITDQIVGGRVDALRSCPRTIVLGAVGCANSRKGVFAHSILPYPGQENRGLWQDYLLTRTAD